MEDKIIYTGSAQLSSLPPPLSLKIGPIEVKQEIWSDGAIVVYIPGITSAHGDGETLEDALEDLRVCLLELAELFIVDSADSAYENSERLKKEWEAFKTLIDVSQIEAA